MRSFSSLSRERGIGLELAPFLLVCFGLRSVTSSDEYSKVIVSSLGFSGSGETSLLRELSLRD